MGGALPDTLLPVLRTVTGAASLLTLYMPKFLLIVPSLHRGYNAHQIMIGASITDWSDSTSGREGKKGKNHTQAFKGPQVNGEPITSESYGAADGLDPDLPRGQGAPKACVGDVIRVPVSVMSRLPEPLTVVCCTLAISVLQVPPDARVTARRSLPEKCCSSAVSVEPCAGDDGRHFSSRRARQPADARARTSARVLCAQPGQSGCEPARA